MIASLTFVLAVSGSRFRPEEGASVRKAKTRYGTYTLAFSVETYGAGGVSGSLTVKRNGFKRTLLPLGLAAGSGVALLPKGRGFMVFDFKEDGYRAQATNQRCVATRYEFVTGGLKKTATRIHMGESYFGKRMWKLYGLPFPKDDRGHVYA